VNEDDFETLVCEAAGNGGGIRNAYIDSVMPRVLSLAVDNEHRGHGDRPPIDAPDRVSGKGSGSAVMTLECG